MTVQLGMDACPYCGHKLDAASNPDQPELVPSEGDYTLCIGCAQLLIFNADVRLRQPSVEEHREAETNAELMKMRAAIREAHRKMGKPILDQ